MHCQGKLVVCGEGCEMEKTTKEELKARTQRAATEPQSKNSFTDIYRLQEKFL